ncbi:NAD dependent epimerase/dehydratase family protein [Cladophialophora carrionii]|uniref:NAD dependent epimerase/dehydratase family protein n=1 Tax=Cladophialophora carrionii TaxID=86049 RepID=A0A1C1CAT1_9EURO|nr:NAD dependent epimerase/dehydratase family protein [Cladophialophora carrionii]
MSTPRVLVLGGHGKVSLFLQPLLLAKKWHVTSVVRNGEHEAEILALGKDKPGTIDVLVDSLDDVKEVSHAARVLDKVKPDIVVWSAGAGGKGGPSRTKAVDEVAAKAYISASLAMPSVKKFLLVSYIASRKGYPPWWTDEDKKAADKVNHEILPHYYQAKVEADEHLEALTKKRLGGGDQDFQAINLRPGSLTDAPGTGKVKLGKTPSRGSIPRQDVARVAAALLDRNDTRGWFDLLEGDDPIEEAVDKLVRNNHDGLEGEDMERIWARPT